MTKLRATTALAADIARIDRQRFNEAIAAGFYPCAPETIAGRARSFNLEDLIALTVYGHLLREGVTPRHAGAAACGLRSFLVECPGTDHALQVVGNFGAHLGPVSWVRPEIFEGAKAASRISGAQIVYVRNWYIGPMREAIISRLTEEDENRTVGADD